MKAVIPVAGIGKRLEPHTFTRPKVLINVAGKPILGHILDSLIPHPISEFVFITGHLGGHVKKYVKEHYRIKTRFIEQKEPLGLGHAISLAIPYLGEEPVFIVLGDTIFKANLNKMLKSKCSVLGVRKVKDPSRFGVALMRGKRIAKLVEKPKKRISDLALVGLYYIKEAAMLGDSLHAIISKKKRTSNEFQLTDGLQHMLENGARIETFNIEGWFDCGKPEALLDTNRDLLSGKAQKINPFMKNDCLVIPPVSIAPTAKVVKSIIGPFVSIGQNASIVRSIISDSLIEERAEILNCSMQESIIGNNARIAGHKQKMNVGGSSSVEQGAT